VPGSVEAVVVLALFLLPGYIATVVFTRNAPRAHLSDFRFVLQIAFWGALVHFVALPWTGDWLLALLRGQADVLATITAAELLKAGLLLLVLPAAVGGATGLALLRGPVRWLFDRLGMKSAAWLPTAWDYAFEPGGAGCWVYVYVKNRAQPIIGMYGPRSMAGVSPGSHDLFLQERHQFVGDSLVKVRHSQGVWIPAAEIELIEIHRAEEATRGKEQPAAPGERQPPRTR
jgi:hypothetical protein